MTLEPVAELDEPTHIGLGVETSHHLRLWRSVDDNDVMARCVCGWVKIDTRLCEVATAWAEHMGVIKMEESFGH